MREEIPPVVDIPRLIPGTLDLLQPSSCHTYSNTIDTSAELNVSERTSTDKYPKT